MVKKLVMNIIKDFSNHHRAEKRQESQSKVIPLPPDWYIFRADNGYRFENYGFNTGMSYEGIRRAYKMSSSLQLQINKGGWHENKVIARVEFSGDFYAYRKVWKRIWIWEMGFLKETKWIN